MWFDSSELERASAAADGAAGADLRDAVRALVPSRSLPSGPAIVACPFCEAALIRRNHPTVPGVVAYVCSMHGAWLERTSLVKLIEDIEAMGLEGVRARDDRRAARRVESEKAAERDLQRMAMLRARHMWTWLL